jgi:hypothetical protein
MSCSTFPKAAGASRASLPSHSSERFSLRLQRRKPDTRDRFPIARSKRLASYFHLVRLRVLLPFWKISAFLAAGSRVRRPHHVMSSSSDAKTNLGGAQAQDLGRF